MLKKLLKYDLRAIFKYWWILAVSSVGLAMIGGICLRTLVASDSEKTGPIIVIISALGVVATVIGLSAFLIITEILIFVRFYKNFFTDEGYLTFTLPVKRSQLLNSKLITTLIANLATFIVLFIDILLILAIGSPDFFRSEIWQLIGRSLRDCIQYMGAYSFIYLIELIALIFCIALSSTLIFYICITLASVVAKKSKIITAIGIYYGISTVVSFSVELIYIFGIMFVSNAIASFTSSAIMGVAALIVFMVLAFVAALCLALYLLEYYLLDKKLNLA
ncbi:MAG: hypothetical protein E7592_03445 [Ruminococcaceae bacterium]|nr:hypothetical protein [Oscillospiraceae bacterium]